MKDDDAPEKLPPAVEAQVPPSVDMAQLTKIADFIDRLRGIGVKSYTWPCTVEFFEPGESKRSKRGWRAGDE